MNKKKILAIMLSSMFVLGSLAGCGKKKAENEDASYSVTLTDSSMLDDGSDVALTKDGMVQSDLTGEWVTPEQNDKRPIAITINNIYEALPQSGVEQADVIFEMLEEGKSVTRLLCVFSNYEDIEQLGPVRSARHYFDRKAMEFDAYFVHWGYSLYAGNDFDTITDLDHMDLNDQDAAAGFRVSRPGKALEHTGYTSGEKIVNQLASHDFDSTKCASYKKMFYFNMEDKEPEGGSDAKKITTTFTAGLAPSFEYDESTKLYKRFEAGGPQIDETTGNQLAFKNVIIQYAPHNFISGDPSGCIDIPLNGEGEGYYISDGKVIPIKWEKKNTASFLDYPSLDYLGDTSVRGAEMGEYGVTQYYTQDGELLKMNPGKTFVTMFPDDNKEGVTIE